MSGKKNHITKCNLILEEKYVNEVIDDDPLNFANKTVTKIKYPCLGPILSSSVEYVLSKKLNIFFIKYGLGILKRESDFGSSRKYFSKAPFEYMMNKLSEYSPEFKSALQKTMQVFHNKQNWVPSMGVSQMKPEIAKRFGVDIEELMTIPGSLFATTKYLMELYNINKKYYSTTQPSVINVNGKIVTNPNSTGNAALDVSIVSYNMGYEKYNKWFCKTNNSKYLAPCDSPNGLYKPYDSKPKFILKVDKNSVVKNYFPYYIFQKLTSFGYLKEVNNFVKSKNCL
jgi:hypothetical protein